MAYKTIVDAIKNIFSHNSKKEDSTAEIHSEEHKEIISKLKSIEIENLHKELERFKKRNIELSQSVTFLLRDEINIAQAFLDAPTNENGDVVLTINRGETEAIKKNFEDCLNKKSK
jgi:hypothetical protein